MMHMNKVMDYRLLRINVYK